MPVTSAQLLLRSDAEGHADLTLVSFLGAATDGEHVSSATDRPRFGTEDLARLAQTFVNRNCRVTHLDIRDLRFQEFPEDLEESYEEPLLAALKFREWTDFRKVLYGVARDVLLVAIEVKTAEGSRFRVDRNGTVRFSRLRQNADALFTGVWAQVEALKP